MTRKHFITIAEIIAQSKDKTELVVRLCSYFATVNKAFNAELFKDACEQ